MLACFALAEECFTLCLVCNISCKYLYSMATEYLPCLQRIGEHVKKYRHLFLEKEQVTIGRSPEVTHCLLSAMISRCHCTLKRNPDSSWTITDNKSLNGVFVNGVKLISQECRKLSEGDMVQLGTSTSPSKVPEFVYIFYPSVKVKRKKRKLSNEWEPNSKQLKSQYPDGENENKSTQSELKCQIPSLQTIKNCINKNPEHSHDCVDGKSPYKKYKDQVKENGEQHAEEMRKIQEQMLEMQEELKKKEEEQIQMLKELNKEKQEREAQAAVLSELKKQEEKLKEEMIRKQEALLKEKGETEKLIREELEKQLKHRENELMNYLKIQRESLLSEKQQVEERLQNEKTKALEEKDKLLESELLYQKEQLEKVIVKKELEQKALENQLRDTKAESEKQKESVLQAREDILSKFAELMEKELQCSICNELFVQATSLNCSHSFCALCINNWMKRKKECPVCRSKVTSFMRSIVLDSYIDTMTEHLSSEMKEKRRELIEIRKEEQAIFDEDNKTSRPGRSGLRDRRRVRGRSQTHGRASHHNTAVISRGPVPPPLVIESDIRDEDSYRDGDTSNSSTDDSDPYHG